MAESLDDAEFWLPPQFLADNESDSKDLAFVSDMSSSQFPFEFTSDLNFPVVGSSETESDEEDLMAGLTLQIARSTLDDRFKATTDSAFASENGKPRGTLSGSPQSTLCALASACGCESRGSLNEAHSGVSSPPPPLSPPSTSTWDLLNAAADQVANMRKMSRNNSIEEEYKFFHGRPGGLLNTPRKPSFVNPSAEFFLNEAVSQKQLQFQQPRQQQMMKQQSSTIWGNNNTSAKLAGWYQQNHQTAVQNRARNQNGRPLRLSPSAWPSLQQQKQESQQNGSGMRAVFLGNPLGKRECTGTGVFLPRQTRPQPETGRKPACSTVLVPARVVQALNLNLGDMCGGAHPQIQPQFNGRYTPDTDLTLRLRSNNVLSHPKRYIDRSQPQVNHEIRLPHDWTY